ncbi:MAG: prepilin-type N-terminal cleavage/methylation domain-containing protein [Mycobacterium sp.]|uniref:prepilin-type N-terminal cleavage/methylation domain-containing protein n=1 Tax=Mycobacterium sp. TaxID=1785 RepID=UPI0038999D36
MTRQLKTQSGFTIVEVMVAIMLLLVGVLGTVKLVDSSAALNVNTRHRDAATNLARQIIEVSRNLEYSSLSNGAVTAALQAQPGLGDADLSKPNWQVVRKGTTFTVSVSACTYDDPKDGTRTAANGTCVGQAPVNPNDGTVAVDSNPDDFRRVSVNVSWQRIGAAGAAPSCGGDAGGNGLYCVSQTSLIPNPSGGLGPTITSATYVGSPHPIETGSGASISAVTDTAADHLDWSVNDAVSSGTASHDPDFVNWTFTWPFDPVDVDGTYTISMQAFLLSSPGPVRPLTITLNRSIPAAPVAPPAEPAIGFNTRIPPGIVEIAWRANPERDLSGYRVFRGSTPTLTSAAVPVPGCDVGKNTTSCFDSAPDPGINHYYVVALDSRYVTGKPEDGAGSPGSYSCGSPVGTVAVDLSAPYWPSTPAPGIRPGCPSDPASRTIDTSALPDDQPTNPGPLAITSSSGLPHLSWPQAPDDPSGDAILFYRIYRDPSCPNATGAAAAYTNRCGRTASATATTFDDGTPVTTSGTVVTYYVTAVDSHYQESDPIIGTWTVP